MINLATILPLKSKFSGKLQRFNVTDASIEMQECNFWTSRNSALQMVFFDTKQKNVCRKIFKVRKFFGCVSEAYCFLCHVS